MHPGLLRCHRRELVIPQGSELGGFYSLPRWVRRKWGHGRGPGRRLWANESRREIQIDGDWLNGDRYLQASVPASPQVLYSHTLGTEETSPGVPPPAHHPALTCAGSARDRSEVFYQPPLEDPSASSSGDQPPRGDNTLPPRLITETFCRTSFRSSRTLVMLS